MKKLQAGMPTLLECGTLEENVRLCAELGLSFVEMNMDVPIYTPERIKAATLREIQAETGVFFTAHMPEQLDLASHHLSIREGTLHRCLETIRWASEAGIKLLNMHLNPGIYFTLPQGKAWINERYEEEFLALLVQSFEQVYAWSRQYGVPVCIENTLNFHYSFIQNALQKLSAFEEFCLTWDVGHDAKSGMKDRPVVMQHVDRIRHLHVHDFDGQSDHLAFGTGVVNLQNTLLFARVRELTFVVETKTVDAL
ncbi:MAG: sugar phosphate isomerase/epimerase family protein, partial [Tumebacillaceae bacterium]